MNFEERFDKIKELKELMEKQEVLLEELELTNFFENNHYYAQQCMVEKKFEEAKANLKVKNNSNTSTLLDALKLLGKPILDAYHLVNGDYIELENNRIFYTSYPFNRYGGRSHIPKYKNEITKEKAIELLNEYKVI